MIDLNGKLRLHEGFATEVVRVGTEQVPVLVVDNFLSDPGLLVDYAAAHAAFRPDVGAYYPGARAPAPQIYGFALRAFLGSAIADAFDLKDFKVTSEKCDFSLVTTPPERLQVLQRMPHIDNTNPKHFAVLHYLSQPEQGGTSFYRHRETGFETVNAGRFAAYKQAVQSQLAANGPPPPSYIDGDSAMFERIASFEGVFNRVLVYRGLSLHSADIRQGASFACDARTGRLTANAFIWLG